MRTGHSPRPNVEVFGKALTVTLEELEETVQREKPDLSSALDADGTRGQEDGA